MKKSLIPLFIILLTRSILCDCAPALFKSVTLDTISPGVVIVTECYSDFWIVNHYVQAPCTTYLSFELNLSDTLRNRYLNKNIMAVCHIDSVRAIHDSIWTEDAVHESLFVVIDTVYKGSLPKRSAWFTYLGGCVAGFAPLVNIPFISFMNDVDSLPAFGINPAPLGSYPSGFFLTANRISTSSMLGVSVDLGAFLAAMTAGIKNAARNPAGSNLPSGDLTFNKLYKLVQRNNLLGLQFFTAGGRLVFSSGNSQAQLKFLNNLKMDRGIFFVRLMDGKSASISRLLFAR